MEKPRLCGAEQIFEFLPDFAGHAKNICYVRHRTED
jgi:hypothetical protein